MDADRYQNKRKLVEIESTEQVRNLELDEGRLFNSAEHHEIMAGHTTDIYFIKTREMLEHLDLQRAQVTAEVFASASGVFCGINEVKNLLDGRVDELYALPEGAEFEKKEVVMRISGRYVEFATAETPLLGMLASASAWATRAKEVKEAAGNKVAVCFGARHIHPSVAPVMERAAMIGGMDGNSCVLAAKLMGKFPMGTVPHAAIIVAGDTLEIAHAYDEIMPEDDARIILVDTFKDEAEETLRVAEFLGEQLDAVRLDTPKERGRVTTGLVREIRARLDMAGREDVEIFCSGGLNPDRIRQLADAGADGFGVGSYISAAPSINMTLDLKEVDGKPVAKRGRIPGLNANPRLEKIF